MASGKLPPMRARTVPESSTTINSRTRMESVAAELPATVDARPTANPVNASAPVHRRSPVATRSARRRWRICRSHAARRISRVTCSISLSNCVPVRARRTMDKTEMVRAALHLVLRANERDRVLLHGGCTKARPAHNTSAAVAAATRVSGPTPISPICSSFAGCHRKTQGAFLEARIHHHSPG